MTKEFEVGVVGVGNMGSGIARNFIDAGVATAVWDVSEERLAAFAGRAAAPRDMAAAGATVFFAVPATPDIEAELDAMLESAGANLVVYDLTTSYPDDTRRLAERAAARGVPYLDAAMSGGATGAAAGTLTLMIGGDAAALARTRRHLEVFADNIFHLGDSGAGHTMKLIHNMVCHSIFLATCEGGRLCERAGLRLEDMIAAFNVSNARSYASEFRFPKHVLTGKWDGRSSVRNLRKDLEMAARLADAADADATFSQATLAFLDAAAALGMEDEDFSLLYRDFERIRSKRDAG